MYMAPHTSHIPSIFFFVPLYFLHTCNEHEAMSHPQLENVYCPAQILHEKKKKPGNNGIDALGVRRERRQAMALNWYGGGVSVKTGGVNGDKTKALFLLGAAAGQTGLLEKTVHALALSNKQASLSALSLALAKTKTSLSYQALSLSPQSIGSISFVAWLAWFTLVSSSKTKTRRRRHGGGRRGWACIFNVTTMAAWHKRDGSGMICNIGIK